MATPSRFDSQSLFTVFLTHGAYVVERVDRDRLLEAIAARERILAVIASGTAAPRGEPIPTHLTVRADLLGDGLYTQPLDVILAHVVSIAENVPDASSEGSYGPTGGPAFSGRDHGGSAARGHLRAVP